MKGLLLKPAFLDELIKVRSIDAMVELLQRTHYKEELVSLSLKHKGSLLVELAAGIHFAKIVDKIRAFSPRSDRSAVIGLLKRWDLLNLKTLLNGLRSGKNYDAIKPYLIPVGSLSEHDFERIAKAQDLLAELKKTDLGRELLSQSTALFSKQMFSAFNNALRDMDSFMQLQTILDAYIYLLIDKALGTGDRDIERIKRIMKKEIDAKNIVMIFRLKKYAKAKIKNYLIRGGSLGDSVITQLIDAKDISSAERIIKSKFSAIELQENASMVDLEIALEKAIAAEKLAAFHVSVLSIGVMLGFLLLKEEELNNLRKIAKAKEFGIPEDEVRKMLVVV